MCGLVNLKVGIEDFQKRLLITAHPKDFKQDFKTIQEYFYRIKAHASGVQNVFFMKSLIIGHRFQKLDSLADSHGLV